MTESEAREQRRKQMSETVFRQWSGAARAYAGRPERKQVENREVKQCQEK